MKNKVFLLKKKDVIINCILQFYHDVRHLESDMETFLQWMDSPTVKAPVKTSDPEVILQQFRVSYISRQCECTILLYI